LSTFFCTHLFGSALLVTPNGRKKNQESKGEKEESREVEQRTRFLWLSFFRSRRRRTVTALIFQRSQKSCSPWIVFLGQLLTSYENYIFILLLG
jgi:hypothetical protein